MTARLCIAGVASGVGKTTTVLALAAALRARGLRVAAFKCGPDYLDPTYHARATGAPSQTLDAWMMGREAVRATFARHSRGADVALIEGMMGLYDGVAPDGDGGSAAEIARWLEAPVVVVVDASGIARTLAAIGLGLRVFDPALALAGLCANRVGSRGHLELLATACRAHVPVVGGLPHDPAGAFPERHLGLRAADAAVVPDARVAAWGETFAAWNDVDAWLALARRAAPLDELTAAPSRPAPRCRIGVARDAAFHFYYADNLERLEALGAELVPFSPLGDARPPAVDGVYLGGGYPELHAAALAANDGMRQGLRALAAAGAPVYAECGGLMYLADAIRAVDGARHPMLGLVAGTAVMHAGLQAIGYVEVETRRPTPLGAAGQRLRGHQFRHSTLEGASGDAYHVRPAWGGAAFVEGYGAANVLGSYVHVHWASCPGAAAGFVDACAAFRGRR